MQKSNQKLSHIIFTSANNLSINEVAKILKKDPQFIRIGLQTGKLPIGTAFKVPGSNQYSYYVSPKLLYEYTGYLYNPNKKKYTSDD